MDDKKLVMQSKNTRDFQSVDPNAVMEDMRIVTKKDMYSVDRSGKLSPGVKIARIYAQENGINTKIISCQKDKTSASCHIRVWKGPEEKPTLITERVVIHSFEHLLQQAVFDAIANGLWVPTGKRDNKGQLEKKFTNPDWDIHPETGLPFLKDKWAQFQIMQNYLNKIKHAERDAFGKAERNAILELALLEEEKKVSPSITDLREVILREQKEETERASVQIVDKTKPDYSDANKNLLAQEKQEKIHASSPVTQGEIVSVNSPINKPTDSNLLPLIERIRSELLKVNGGNSQEALRHFREIMLAFNFKYDRPANITSMQDAEKTIDYIETIKKPVEVSNVEFIDDAMEFEP